MVLPFELLDVLIGDFARLMTQYGLFWNTLPITLIGMPFSLRDDQRADRPVADLRLAARHIGDRIHVGAARNECRLDAVLLEVAVLDPGEIAAVLDALDPGELERERLRLGKGWLEPVIRQELGLPAMRKRLP